MKNRHKSILATYSKIEPVLEYSTEGVDYINISKYSETKLGKALSPGAKVNFVTVFGKVGNIRSAMDYIAVPNYPVKLLSKTKLTAADIGKIPKKRLSVPNYWSIVTYIVARRIESDNKLIQMIKENDAEFTCFSKIGNTKLFGHEVFLSQPNVAMGRYVAIIRCISKLIKEDRFNNVEIHELIKKAKDHPDKTVFGGSTIIINI